MLNSLPSSAEASFSPARSPLLPARISLSVWFISYTILISDVWTCRWSLGLLLFYLNRYLPVLDLFLFLHRTACYRRSHNLSMFVLSVAFILVLANMLTMILAIIVLRTYAIWGRRRLILWILTPIAVILFGSMLGITAWKTSVDYHEMRSFTPASSMSDRQKCTIAALAIDKKRRIALLGLYVMVFLGEAAIVVLTIIKANQHISKISPRWVSQLYKNGIIYCICMLGLSLVNACVLFAAPVSNSPSYLPFATPVNDYQQSQYKPIVLPAQRSLHSMFSNRVILLIFQNRKRNAPENNEDNRPRPNTYAESAMDVFTSVYPEPIETGTDETSWQARAQMEWVH
ncbi:hypothetical protein CVT25_014058 [Psilocybe cyanescens]|uniref:G-protein coupled receptors family 1 profile domain-containing protein n=1 Tax=Psilocybe cyanescens TaxID=93625 RepID=A0A409X1U5_PSICY|nr:hypothetical protein CVT25_014058 [Psilocybe cyanescens]